ncbi:immunoglobulin-like domain-containing protein [Calidifontibacillus oryziterrae]|uniref:immunoglobulin-like domain-containing protein n=1 Tax=Calidifontibacillus oryziterrae TaxID=1191699 RepID=UPI000368ECFC|nr:immunoglobulin-like domain-containing protein [Calidifontibacillus oryziterrae]
MYTKGLTKITARFVVICMLIGMWMPAVIPTTVDATDMSADERITADIQALAWDVISGENTTADTITVNLVLPKTGENGSTISWSVSPDDGTINTDTGAVTRPAADSEDKTVTLTATVSYAGGTNQTEDFILIIMKLVEDTYYSVTYDANGGSGTVPLETEKAEGDTFTAGVNSFTPPEGKQFKHWNTKADDTGTPYAEGENVTMPAENLTLYVIWEDEKLVTFGAPWPGDGSGTVADPYQVATADQLNAVRNFLNNSEVYFEQTADIDLEGYANWIPIGDATNPFTGKYNGNGKTISNLTINDGTLEYVGLFGLLSNGGKLENMTLTGVSVTSTNDGVWKEEPRNEHYEGIAHVGGLVGAIDRGTVTDCSSTGNVIAGIASSVGGLVGFNTGGTISSSMSEGTVNGSDDANVGGLVGYNYGDFGNINNSSSSSHVTGGKSDNGYFYFDYSSSIGGLVGRNRAKINNSDSSGNVSGEERAYVGGLVGYHHGNSVSEIKDSSSTGNVTGGDSATVGALLGYDSGGSITLNSIAITTPATKLAYAVGEALDNTGLVVTGTYAGNNKAALPITAANITGFDSSVPADDQVLTITFDGKTTTYAVDISLDWPGDGSGTEADPYQVATADQLDAVRNYLNTSDIYFEQTDDIDLSGYANWTPIGNEFKGTKFAGSYEGNGWTITNLTSSNSLTWVGLFGAIDTGGVLKNITLESVIIENSLTGDYAFAGSLVGHNYGIISNCSVLSGTVSSAGRAGGLLGYNDGSVSSSYSLATVSGGDDEYSGGLIGYNGGTVTNSYSTGDVTGGVNASVGGLIGFNGGIVNNSYSIGAVAGDSDATVGGLVGKNYDEVTNSYYDSETSGQNDDIGKGRPKNTAEMGQQATYEGWDFSGVWRITEVLTYPLLQWQPLTMGEINELITIDTEAITWDIIKGENSAENNVTTGLYLPTAGTNGTTLSWGSSDPTVIAGDGTVTRPSHSEGDKSVTLTATVSKEGGTSQAKSFTLTIKAQPATGGSGGGGGSSSSSNQNSTTADGTVTRTVQNGQKVDQVTINETKATELINDALNKNQNTITIEINTSKEDPADKVEATLSKETLSRISNNDLAVTIESNHATISIPTTTLSNLNQDVTFTIEQIKASTEIQETDSVISIIAPNGTKVGQSLKIETNYEGKTDVTLPLEGIDIPSDPDEQKTFLASLGVLVQHSKDDNEVVTGKIVYDQNNQPIGLSFSIERFSTFTILALPPKEQVENPTSTSIIVNDISGHWAEDTIRQLILKGAVGGYPDGTFKPSQTVTRAEFVAMLAKAIGIEETKNNSKTFSDIQNHWAKNVIEQAATIGIVNGLSEDQFRPNEEITREQMAVMIVNAGALKQVDSKNNFLDSEKIASWAESAVNTAANYKIVNGLPNQTFNPQGKATRAEAATVIMNLLNLNN